MKVNSHSDDVYDLARDIAQLLEAPDKANVIYQGLFDCMRNARCTQEKNDSLLVAGDCLYETLVAAEDDIVSACETGNPESHRHVMDAIVRNFSQDSSSSYKKKLEDECSNVQPSVWKNGHLDLKTQPLVGVLLSIFIHAAQQPNGVIQDYLSKLYDVADMLENYTEVVY